MKALQRFGNASSLEDLRQRVQKEFDYLYAQLSKLENKAPATIGAATGSGLLVAVSSGGATTHELKRRTITYSDGTTLDVLTE